MELSGPWLAFGCYSVCSLILFAFPSLLRKPHIKCASLSQALSKRGIVRIAHRGGSRYAIENTIAAFERCQKVADMLEMDICETKDGVLVVHHDKSLLRTCGVNKAIRDYHLKELPAFKKEIQMDFVEDQKSIKSNGEKIPTLENVFQQFLTIPMNVELKDPSDKAIRELKRLILKYNRLEFTFVGIASPKQKELTEIFPQSYRFFSYGTLPKLSLLYLTGLLPFVEVKEKVLQIPLYTKAYEATRGREKGNGLSNWLYFMGIKLAYYAAIPLLWHLKRRGVLAFYWVCNSESEFYRAIKGGCNGIMTDDPQLLDSYLSRLTKND